MCRKRRAGCSATAGRRLAILMKRKILIVILGLIVLSQLPFAYRRYRLRRLKNAIQQLAAQRSPRHLKVNTPITGA